MSGVREGAWPGDRAPSAEGYGGVDGDCPYCGEKLMWTGWGWSVHSVGYHLGVQRRLLRAVAALVKHEADVRAWEAQNAAQGLVGIRWRCGVYPGWQSEQRSVVPQFIWDLWMRAGPDWRAEYLRDIRTLLAAQFWLEHGVEVNQATWFHRVYDPRVKAGRPG